MRLLIILNKLIVKQSPHGGCLAEGVLTMNKLTEQSTLALYVDRKSGDYRSLDISNFCQTAKDEAGDDYMTAGTITSLVSLVTNDQSDSFYYGDPAGCIEELMEMLSYKDRQYKQLETETGEEMQAMMKTVNNNIAANDDLKSQLNVIHEREKHDFDMTDEHVITDEEMAANKKLLIDFGWTVENMGGGCMVWFKDFMCIDGKKHMVGVDGEAADGCLYVVDKSTYFSLGDDFNGDNNTVTCENPLLHQFQMDEIAVACMWCATSYGIRV